MQLLHGVLTFLRTEVDLPVIVVLLRVELNVLVPHLRTARGQGHRQRENP